MSATNFNTKNDTYRKLMGNGLTYRIPRFQRDYSWTEEEWEDLWLDIVGTIKEGGEPAHYMGYLVLQSDNDKAFDVIDGQQRLTTMSLIVLAVIKNLQILVAQDIDADRNEQRVNQIRQTYIGYLDPVTLVSRSKLTLNRNNDQYFQNYIVPLGPLPQRGFRASEHSLRKAFDWFEKRVRDHVKSTDGDAGVALAQFVETLSDRLFFTVITVTDELNAYKVFETLNARGVRLSATDLLKNYLFSVLHRDTQHDGELHEMELKALEERWEAMVGRLGSESFPDFLRVHWNSRHTFVRQTELFKRIRNDVRDRALVFALLRDMESDMDIYLSLTQPDVYSGTNPQIKEHALELRMFSVRQPFPLLLAAARVLPQNEYATVLRTCVIISFRYNVIGNLPTSEQERVYNAVAEKISLGSLRRVNEIVTALQSVYPSDHAFRGDFAEKMIRTTQSRNNRVVRYILCSLEKHCVNKDYDFASADFNIEHILPEKPGNHWSIFNDAQHEAFVYRLGNMTLLRSSPNRDLGNAPYSEKRAVYADSGFEITRKMAAENDDWTTERIDARQRWMAKQAVGIWRVDQLS